MLGGGVATRRRLVLSETVWMALLKRRTIELDVLRRFAAQDPPEVRELETCTGGCSQSEASAEAEVDQKAAAGATAQNDNDAASELEFGGVLVTQTDEQVWLAGLISKKGLMLLATGDVLVRFGESPAPDELASAAADELDMNM